MLGKILHKDEGIYGATQKGLKGLVSGSRWRSEQMISDLVLSMLMEELKGQA